MSWEQDLERFTTKLEGKAATMLPEIATEVLRSIQVGSEITGAPGQPVDTGNLRASWHLSFPSKEVAEISTNVEYAPYVEDGVNQHGPMTVRSAVGGFHSVAITRMNFDRIVDRVVNAESRPAGFEGNEVAMPFTPQPQQGAA